MFKLITQHLEKRRVQTASVILSVAVSAAVLFSLYLLYLGITAGLDNSAQRMGADLMVVPAEAEKLIEQEELLFGGAPVAIYMPMEKAEQIMARDGIEHASLQFFGQTLDEGCCSSVGAVRLVGYDENSGWLLDPWLEEPVEELGRWEILVGCKAGGYSSGTGRVLGQEVTVRGRLQETSTSLDYSVVLRFDDLRELMKQKENYGHIWAKYGEADTLASAVLIKAEEGRKDEVANGIMSLGGVRVFRAADVLSEIHDRMFVVFAVMLGAGLLLAASSILQLFARFYSLVWDRKGEWGLYRAIGASRRDLKCMIYGEALLMTVGGAAAGLLLGQGLYSLLLRLLERYQTFPFIAPGFRAVACGALLLLLLYTVVAVAAAALPARRSGRIDPSSAMAMGDID